MRYNNISNQNYHRATITHPWTDWDDAFTDTELMKIEDYCQFQEQDEASIMGTKDKSKVKKVRISNISFHRPNSDTEWIFERLNNVIEQVNNKFYGFDINGYESFQYTTYKGSDKGKYDWHMDMSMGDYESHKTFETRKISLTLNLNDDYEGGKFKIITGNIKSPQTLPTKKGRCILFPSFVLHSVAPVTSGVRKSVVVWVLGPKFC
jgi:PKHD-type hydroxylase